MLTKVLRGNNKDTSVTSILIRVLAKVERDFGVRVGIDDVKRN